MDSAPAIHRLARAYGLHAGYVDYTGEFRGAAPDILAAVLSALGASPHDHDIGAQILARELARYDAILEPVTVAWDGLGELVVRLPQRLADRKLEIVITREDGVRLQHAISAADGRVVETIELGGTRFIALAIPLQPPGAHPLAWGYHRLELAIVGAGRSATASIFSAPRRAWSPAPGVKHHGLFIPLHALQSERSLGVGDFTDLGDLAEWAHTSGGSVVGTLPLLASFLDEPCDPSPYTPCSRLAWNELYLDVEAVPEYADSARARAKLEDPEARALIARLRAMPLVDHRAEMAMRRAPLELMAAELFERGGARRAALEAFAIARPEIVDYARFRSALERHRVPWDRWPEAARTGTLSTADIDATAFRYHLYVQFCCDEQLARLSQRSQAGGLGLYLDLPIGVHGAGYDTWREHDAFVHGLATGAPPDLLFAGGQNWAFPPLHPQNIRLRGHRYPIAMLRNHLRYAKVLRIDHVMGLHRLYVIPQGASARDGIYLSYPNDELYAILSIESHRSHTLLVGEDLGTVPPDVHQAMAEHGICGMHVVEYAAKPHGRALPHARRDQVASVNTHDMPTFRAFWEGLDIDDQVDLGWLDARAAEGVRRGRAQLRGNLRALWAERSPLAPDADAELAYDACVTDLGESEAVLTILALEDLWGEVRPHNVPGTWLERPNWRRRARLDLSAIIRDPQVADRMRRIDRARRGATAGGTVRYDVSPLTADDEHWFNEGTHESIQRKLGAHAVVADGIAGTHFAVWAPSAESVAVIGDFNGWNRERHPLRPRGSSGIWEGFVPGVGVADRYKFHVRGHGTAEDKTDPVARWNECPPRTASLVASPEHRWRDQAWMAGRGARNRLDAPISIYEVHLGSWMRVPEEGGRVLGYRELGPKLAAHCTKLGFTHVELLPVMEHPFYGSWGYQSTGYFAPTARYGGPADFMAMIDTLHQAGIAVILDWVPSHFPGDGHGLAQFDGTRLYEHDDPRKGFHPDWQSWIFNYGRYEVCSFLISSALAWLSDFHVDGLRVDAVASMLYLDYSRSEGEWVPNRYGGRENLEAIALLRRLNEAIFRAHPDVQTFAEESTAWPMVSRPTWLGGLGFGFKWDMGWMHDMLQYMARDPIHRGWHQHELTFRMIYAFAENYVLPLSHDEVVHGKGSLLSKMPGDRWQQFANLRLLYGAMWGQPGKKLLFMGGEFGQIREWNHDISLDWHLLSDPMHAGVSAWITDLNRLLRECPALHELDVEPGGYEWVDFSDAANSVLAWLRRARDGSSVLVVCNFTPVPRHDYRVGVPEEGEWLELANSDAAIYGGSGVGNWGAVWSDPVPVHDRSHSLRLTLPPLSASFFARRQA